MIGIVEKEAAETQYWLELCKEISDGELRNCAIGDSQRELDWLLQESRELLAIFNRANKTAKARR